MGGAMTHAAAAPRITIERARSWPRLRRAVRRAGFWLSVVVIVSPAILVFLWMLSLSLKNEIDNLAYPPVFIPDPPTIANYVQVFSENSMGLYFRNSLVVSGCAMSARSWSPCAAADALIVLSVAIVSG